MEKYEPYRSYQERVRSKKGNRGFKSLKASKQLISREIKRRDPGLKINVSNKSAKIMLKELASECRLTDPRDISFVKNEERNFREHIRDKLSSTNESEVAESIQRKKSPQNNHYRMRLICCFQDDNIVIAYRQTQDSMTTMELDARNSTARPHDFYDLVVAKFNDTTWIPTSAIIPDLHPDFEQEREWAKRESK